MLTRAAGAFVQSVLTQLGLSEAQARAFLIEEVKGPARSRRSPMISAGRAGFLKLPPAARGPAATALFAWAKAYVNTPSFKSMYDEHRKGLAPEATQYETTVDEEVKKRIAEQLATLAEARKNAALLPPADRAQILESLKQLEAQLRSADNARTVREEVEEERGRNRSDSTELAKTRDEKFPADLRSFFAARLREFLEATADVNFDARTINLTGGTEGIEFINADDRERPWKWQEAAIVGREATTAARAAAEAWLKELAR